MLPIAEPPLPQGTVAPRARLADAGAPRVVQFTKGFWVGGTEVQVLELLRGLPPHVSALRVAVLEQEGPLLPSVRALGHEPRAFPLGGSAMSATAARRIVEAARWLRGQGAQLVHVHDFYATLVAVPAARLAGCKVVVGRLDLAHWHSPLQRRALRLLTRSAHHVVANAEAIRQQLLTQEGLPRERVSVIHNGRDVAAFDRLLLAGPQAPLPDTGSAPVVLHVANMGHPVKRQEDLIAALALARQHVPALRLFLVGDGPRRPMLERLAAQQRVTDAVHFLGQRPDVPALYARAAVGVNCSSAEGLSNAVMEGMAASTPMVVTDVGGNPELVADGVRGRVVPPASPEALAAALVQLVRAPAAARAMGRAGRAHVEECLSLQRMVEAHAALYRRLVGGGKP
jgi:L-malate glycosyltransferase